MALRDLLKNTQSVQEPAAAPVPDQPPAEQEQENKKKRKAPQDESRRTRNSQVKIRLTEEEVAKLKRAAADAGMSMADFIMAGIDQTRVVKVPGAAKVMANLHLCGSNLNQAVRLGHVARRQGESVDMKDIEKAVADLENTIIGFAEFLKKWDVDLAGKVRRDVSKNANR